MILEVGRVCRKTRGKDSGAYCVVVDKPEKGCILIDGKGIKRKKISIHHIEPIPVILKINKNAKTNTIIKALEKEGI